MEVILHNSSNSKVIYVFVRDINDTDEPQKSPDGSVDLDQITFIDKDEKISIKMASGGVVLYIYGADKSLLWSGIVPTSIDLDFNPDTKVLTAGSDTIPSGFATFSSQGGGSAGDTTKTIFFVAVGIIIVLVIIAILYHLITRKPGRRMRRIEMEDF